MQILHYSICKVNYCKIVLAIQGISQLYVSAVSHTKSTDVNKIGV